jgi:DNA-binding MarR family transcriptional regulator
MTAAAKTVRTGETKRSSTRSRAAKPKADPKPAASEAGAPLDLGVLNDVMGFRLRRIQNHLARAFSEQANYPGKAGMFSVLALIGANPGVSQVRLAQEAGVDKTALVPLLDHIEDLGWATRRRAKEDRRKHSLSLTPMGEAALAELTERAHDAEAGARASLSAQEFELLLGLLDKLYASCFREEVL